MKWWQNKLTQFLNLPQKQKNTNVPQQALQEISETAATLENQTETCGYSNNCREKCSYLCFV